MKYERITIDPGVMVGKPCIKGTRITVESILEKLAADMSYEEILEDHPRLAREDILAALAFARDYLARQDIILADGQSL
jgi:uncharacterized protein (DUF433 family)